MPSFGEELYLRTKASFSKEKIGEWRAEWQGWKDRKLDFSKLAEAESTQCAAVDAKCADDVQSLYSSTEATAESRLFIEDEIKSLQAIFNAYIPKESLPVENEKHARLFSIMQNCFLNLGQEIRSLSLREAHQFYESSCNFLVNTCIQFSEEGPGDRVGLFGRAVSPEFLSMNERLLETARLSNAKSREKIKKVEDQESSIKKIVAERKSEIKAACAALQKRYETQYEIEAKKHLDKFSVPIRDPLHFAAYLDLRKIVSEGIQKHYSVLMEYCASVLDNKKILKAYTEIIMAISQADQEYINFMESHTGRAAISICAQNCSSSESHHWSCSVSRAKSARDKKLGKVSEDVKSTLTLLRSFAQFKETYSEQTITIGTLPDQKTYLKLFIEAFFETFYKVIITSGSTSLCLTLLDWQACFEMGEAGIELKGVCDGIRREAKEKFDTSLLELEQRATATKAESIAALTALTETTQTTLQGDIEHLVEDITNGRLAKPIVAAPPVASSAVQGGGGGGGSAGGRAGATDEDTFFGDRSRRQQRGEVASINGPGSVVPLHQADLDSAPSFTSLLEMLSNKKS